MRGERAMKSIVLCDNGKPESILLLCEKYGFGIEIQGFYNPNETDNRNDIMAMYKDIVPSGMVKYLHAPFWDLCLGSANKKIVEVTRFYFDYAYEIAEGLGCLGITVHHGYVPGTSHPPNWIKRSVAFWDDFFNSHPGTIKMFMENQCERNPETLSGIIDGYPSDRLAVNLDIGHAHCNNPLPVIEWVKQLGSRIGYVHLHQNHGSEDEHLGLRKGNIPMAEVLNALSECAPDAVWALECGADDMEESIEFLCESGLVG